MKSRMSLKIVVWMVALLLPLVSTMFVKADQVILDDLIVDGSSCVGFDCVDGESFGFDTLRLKENNLRIHFDDTSAGAFPTQDWRFTANASGSGGLDFFSIDTVGGPGGDKVPFLIVAGAPTDSFRVSAGGNIGLGTANPILQLQVTDGNTPAIRLEQDASSGFTAQTWDVAGNEANFFVRDVTGGSKLPFRIRPNAPTSSIDIEGTTGDVGIGTGAPDAPLHVRRTSALARILVEDAQAVGGIKNLLTLRNGTGGVQMRLEKDSAVAANADTWILRNDGNNKFALLSSIDAGATNTQLTLDTSGNLAVTGTISSNGTTLTVPDYVFEPDYKLVPLSDLAQFIAENKHLPNIPSADEVKASGQVNLSELQMKLLEKIEELTLYAIGQQQAIDDLKARLEKVERPFEKVQ